MKADRSVADCTSALIIGLSMVNSSLCIITKLGTCPVITKPAILILSRVSTVLAKTLAFRAAAFFCRLFNVPWTYILTLLAKAAKACGVNESLTYKAIGDIKSIVLL